MCSLAQTDGSVTGAVLTQDGTPLMNARVHIAKKSPFYGSRVVDFHETDSEGKFVINHVPWGSYVVMAGKEEDGYADTKLVFYINMEAPVVELGPLFPTANVTVHLGPKAGVIHIDSITDATTGRKIPNAGVTLRRAANSEFFMSVSSSTRDILVPSNTSVILEIEEQGYQPWPQADKMTQEGKIRLDAGQVFNLNVKLLPLVDPNAEIMRILHRTLYAQPIEISHGTMLTSPLSPSGEDVQRLRELGEQSIFSLAKYLESSASILDQQVVLCLLDNIGSEQALDLLVQFAEKAEPPVVRSKALGWLAKDKRPRDMLRIQNISVRDSDADVREAAAKVLKQQ